MIIAKVQLLLSIGFIIILSLSFIILNSFFVLLGTAKHPGPQSAEPGMTQGDGVFASFCGGAARGKGRRKKAKEKRG